MVQWSGPSPVEMLASVTASRSTETETPLSGIVGEIHEHHVPQYAREALDRLYGSLYASYRYLSLCSATDFLPHCWIGRRHGEIIGVLLFRPESTHIRVLTEMFVLSETVAAASSRDLFVHFPQVRRIAFNAIGMQTAMKSLPQQSFAYSENYVLDLPPSAAAYEAALGKSTRKTIRGYGNRFMREHPGFEWHSYQGNELPSHMQRTLIRQLQMFKRASMAQRGKQAQNEIRQTARLLLMASDCGLYSLGTIDGKLCAGSLACRIGDHYVMLLCASDPAYSAYRLGLLSCYWSINDCIAQGARQCHLLWGRYRYKEQLLAVPILLHQLTIYRSHRQMLWSPVSVLTLLARGWRHRLRSWAIRNFPAWSNTLLKKMTKPMAYFFIR